ncbi:hypothetical protein MNBD_GAMMA11-2993 [hydrothermal vent metagenome]|uniref:Alpha/beta hydrolase n=1 Tax=hydrothermal vent metagenome TaxID=652676 RepID=A0A3B0X655_9ZZZZ
MQIVYRTTFLLVALVLLLSGGCTLRRGVSDIAKENSLIEKYYQSRYFSHVILHNELYSAKASSTLYVFIEGDGLPWKTRSQISADPDPMYPLALDLMSVTEYPSVYISRPCYLVRDERCHPQWWTDKRYSKQVVESIMDILHKVSVGFDEITLVGYSGGGALAVLMARSMSKVTGLVTLAGNMDHSKWTRWHGYSPLQGSLNSNDYILPGSVNQYHYAAENDKNILPVWIKNFSDKQKKSHFILLENVDHRCCWLRNWPRIINQVNGPWLSAD